MQPVCSRVATASSSRLCKSLCSTCSDGQLTTQCLHLGQAQRWSLRRRFSCSCLSQSSWWSLCMFSRHDGLDSHCGHVHTHQHVRLLVDWNRHRNHTFACALHPIDLIFRLLFSNIETPCLLVNFSDSTIMWPCCVSHISLLWRQVSEMNITSHATWCTSLNSSSNLSLEFNDLVFFCRTMNVVFSVFSLECEADSCRCCCFLLWLPSGGRHRFVLLPLRHCLYSVCLCHGLPLCECPCLPCLLWSSKEDFLAILTLKEIWILSVPFCFLFFFLCDYS